jgi:hypothetical protein
MLGRLKMSIDECIEAYMQLSNRIFQKKRHRVTVRGKIQGRFDSDELEQAVKEVIRGQGLQDDALLKDAPGSTCKVQVNFIPYSKPLPLPELTMAFTGLSAQRAKRLVRLYASRATTPSAALPTS